MSCFFLFNASPYSKEFAVASRLLALAHDAAGQLNALDGIGKALPCLLFLYFRLQMA
jgi:hypothetical protein